MGGLGIAESRAKSVELWKEKGRGKKGGKKGGGEGGGRGKERRKGSWGLEYVGWYFSIGGGVRRSGCNETHLMIVCLADLGV